MGGIYLSTGAFIGRINGRNWRLLAEHAREFRADGFEWMIFGEFTDKLGEIVAEYRRAGVPVRTVHADKGIGNLLSEPGDAAWARAEELFLRNCEATDAAGAERMVLHGWGIPHSDEEPERLYERVGRLYERGKGFRADICVENCVCTHGSPLAHLSRIVRDHPEMGVVFDTRCAGFHGEIEATCLSPLMRHNVRHIHIGDFHGKPGDFSALHPILMPGAGDIDWPGLFSLLRDVGYAGTYTLESPAMRSEGVDAEALNQGLDFVRKGVTECDGDYC